MTDLIGEYLVTERTVRSLWSEMQKTHVSECGVRYQGMQVKAKAWIGWDVRRNLLFCERCGARTATPDVPHRPGKDLVIIAANYLTPFRDDHARCARRLTL